jgi:plasmid stabilization system protein ParE
MKVVYHPAVQRDLNAIIRYYDEIDPKLADDFWEEFEAFVAIAAEKPTRFHLAEKGRRRVNLERFPYHFLFRQFSDRIRITVVRHHRRKPQYGSQRP